MRYGDRMLLAEANQWPEDVLQYFGAGDECHMAFHFPLMPRIYMAVATEDRHPITDIMRQTPDIPENCQWAVFLRNHDELTLEMVTDRERDYLWNHYAADRRARINLGIRRRLAPLMDNDRRKIELLKALLLSMPGTPVLYYGDEIGMGDNIYPAAIATGCARRCNGRSIATAGFPEPIRRASTCRRSWIPVYGFEAVNVEAQSRSPSSLLNWIKRLIAARRSRRAFGRGTPAVSLSRRTARSSPICARSMTRSILCVANLSRSPQAVELDLSEFRGRQPVELLGRSVFPTVGELPYLLTLQPYSFFWFDLLPAQESAGLQAAPPEFLTLVMPRNWADLFRQHTQPQLENEAIPAFLPRQRWFGEKDQRIKAASVRAHGEIVRQFEDGSGSEAFLAAVVEAQLAAGARPRYFLPLTAVWSPAETELRQGLIPVTLAELRQSRTEGALVDALSQDGFALAIIDAIQREATVPLDGGEIRCRKTPGFDQSALPERFVVRRAGAEQSNSSVFFEEYGMLKLYRRLQPGPHPEVEMSRFLVERAGFANTPPLLATLEIALDGESGAEDARARRAVRVCPQSGRRLDAGAQLPDPLSRRRAFHWRGPIQSGRSRCLLPNAGAPARDPHCGDAPSAGRTRRRRLRFRARADQPRRHRRVARRARGGRGSICCPGWSADGQACPPRPGISPTASSSAAMRCSSASPG